MTTKSKKPLELSSIMPPLSETKKKVDIREKQLFEALDQNGQQIVLKSDLIEHLRQAGLEIEDQRLSEFYAAINQAGENLDLETFSKAIRPNILLIERALQGQLVVPDFQGFAELLSTLFNEVKGINAGAVATYIPQLARVNPEYFAFSVCTIDGQRYEIGDSDVDFCVQSCSKPLTYCLALEEHGEEVVHRYIGREPSGVSFNELKLNKDNRPHNPMINAGAIMSCALINPGQQSSDRFDYVISQWKKACGGEKVGFSNAVYLSERKTADRNFALGYLMRENQAFPPDVDLVETLEFYFQCCSIEVNARKMATIAATLANGGVCPLSGERVFQPQTVQHCLSLMSSCGMYDFSGEFAFTIGLPAKSGVSGALMVVVPNVCGFCVWSPRLDEIGNSVRGVALCQALVKHFKLHNFDHLSGLYSKIDPRIQPLEAKAKAVNELIWAASKGDLGALHRQLVDQKDLNLADYDDRTPLHLAAAEGQYDVVEYLLDKGWHANQKDRWGGTALNDALANGHEEIASLLKSKKGKLGDFISPSIDFVEKIHSREDSLKIGVTIWAAFTGNLFVLRQLKARGINLNDGDYDARTPLHLAAAQGQLQVIKYLLAQKVEVNPRDRWGFTPLDDAIRSNRLDVIAYLQQNGGLESTALSKSL